MFQREGGFFQTNATMGSHTIHADSSKWVALPGVTAGMVKDQPDPGAAWTHTRIKGISRRSRLTCAHELHPVLSTLHRRRHHLSEAHGRLRSYCFQFLVRHLLGISKRPRETKGRFCFSLSQYLKSSLPTKERTPTGEKRVSNITIRSKKGKNYQKAQKFKIYLEIYLFFYPKYFRFIYIHIFDKKEKNKFEKGLKIISLRKMNGKAQKNTNDSYWGSNGATN
jgi:hypothetical protein